MDRPFYYTGQAPRAIDLATGERNTLTALGVALLSILDNGTCVDGLACTPGGSLTIQVGPGAIYSLAAIDTLPYGPLAADTNDQIMQQGITMGQQPFTLTAPTTSGQSVVYLVEAQFQQVDSGLTQLEYYQSANPTQPLQGIPTNTMRKGVCALQVKAGTPATTGLQTPPAVDAGWVPLWTVTVAYGQGTISQGNIGLAAGAPYIQAKLDTFKAVYGNPNGNTAGWAGTAGKTFPSVVFDLQNAVWWVCTTTGTATTAVWTEVGGGLQWPFYAGISTGTANAQSVTIPAAVQDFGVGDTFWFTVGAGLTNTGAMTIHLPAQGQFPGGTYSVLKEGQNGPVPLVGGEIVAGNTPIMKFDGTALHLGTTELGTASLKNTGNTVVDPGTGNLETASPVSAQTGNAYTYGAANRGCMINRSNGGVPMSDGISSGMVNGWWTEIYNSDASASLSVTAVGCALNGVAAGSVTLTPGQSISVTADNSGNLWTTVQPVQTVATIGSPYSFAYQTGFIN